MLLRPNYYYYSYYESVWWIPVSTYTDSPTPNVSLDRIPLVHQIAIAVAFSFSSLCVPYEEWVSVRVCVLLVTMITQRNDSVVTTIEFLIGDCVVAVAVVAVVVRLRNSY